MKSNKQTPRIFSVILILITTIIMCTPFVSCSQSSKDVSLDGRSFTVISMEKGKTESTDLGTMSFANGMFDSESCHIWGFSATNYTATKDGNIYHFEAVMTSTQEGQETYTGTIDGDKVNGEMVWHKNGQHDIVYSFTSENYKVVSLDGKTYTSDMKVGDSTMTEEIYFAAGKFESPGCYQWGFSSSPYQAWEYMGITYWQSVYQSSNEGMMYFYGTIGNSMISLNNLWVKKGQDNIDNIFESSTGTLKQ